MRGECSLIRLFKINLISLTAAALMAVTACSGHMPVNQEHLDKPFAGQKITLYAQEHPWTEEMEKGLVEFEEATGIEVEVQTYTEGLLKQKLDNGLEAASNVPDVYTYRPYMSKLHYSNKGWSEPLNEYVSRNEEYHFEDFSKASIDGSMVGDKLLSIPLWTDQFVMYYRKDILELNNIAVPETLDELGAAAKKLNDPANGFYGFAARGERNALVSAVSSFIYSEGGDFIIDGKAALNTPEAVSGFQIYAKLLKEYGPEDVHDMGWPEAAALFAEGKAAFYLDAAALYKNTTDPNKSIVAEHVAFAPFPAGAAEAKPYAVTAWALAMNPNSPNKEAAWAFMEWATSQANVLRIQRSGVPGARDSVWAASAGVEMFPADLSAAIKETMEIGVDHSVPQVINVSEARDIIGEIVVKAVQGENIYEAADEANKALQALIDREQGIK